MSFPIDVTIPAANNDPADDQPLMQQNFANISSFLAVDHIAPGTIGDGFHKQITYFTENIPGAVTDPVSIGFTANAALLPSTSNSATTVAQEFYKNNNGIFPTSALRAFALFTNAPGPVIPISNGFNVVSINNATAALMQTYTITLTAGATNGTNFLVLVTVSNNAVVYTYSVAANVITLILNVAAIPLLVNVAVLQI